MRPMSRKTRIGCPLPQFVEWALVGSRSLLLDPLRSSLRAGAIRRECKSLAHSSGPPQPADLTTPARTNRQMTNDDIAFLRQLADQHDRGRFNFTAAARLSRLADESTGLSRSEGGLRHRHRANH